MSAWLGPYLQLHMHLLTPNNERGREKNFAAACHRRLRGPASSSNVSHLYITAVPQVPCRIHSYLPEPEVLVVLRGFVESHVFVLHQKKKEDVSV